jgi:hypothetical protein
MTENKKISGVKVWLDKDFLQNTKGSGELLTCLEKHSVTTIIENLPVSKSIFWTRNATVNTHCVEEAQHDHIMVKIECEKFAEYASEYRSSDECREMSNLVTFLNRIKSKANVNRITLLIQNFKQYCKSLPPGSKVSPCSGSSTAGLVKIGATKKQATKYVKLGKSDMNEIQIRLELEHVTCVRSYETVEELKDLVLSYTKSISEYLIKNEQSENLLFCDKAVEKSQSKVSKDGQGLINLWKEIIETFPHVSSDQAQAICSVYPSPFLLKKVIRNKHFIFS